MPDNNNLQAALVQIAQDFVVAMAMKVQQNKLPEKINNATSIKSPQQAEGKLSIDIVIDTSENGAPMAGAFEWGSGIHRTRETPALYPIVSKSGGLLAIPRSRWPNYEPPPDVDPVVLRKVNHPGVAPRPYITPTIVDQAPNIREKLGKAFKATILTDVKPYVVIEVK